MIGKPAQTASKIVRLVMRGGRKVLRSPRESILIFRMAIWVFILSVLVKLQPLPRALRMIAPRTHGRLQRSPEETEKTLSRAIDLLLGIDLLVFKPVCWKRAAVLHRYLALNGVPTRIMFGVRKDTNGAIAGHAWLETGGKPLLERTFPDYVVTYAYPSNDPFNLDLRVLTGDPT